MGLYQPVLVGCFDWQEANQQRGRDPQSAGQDPVGSARSSWGLKILRLAELSVTIAVEQPVGPTRESKRRC